MARCEAKERKILVAVDEGEESMYALSWCLNNILVSQNSKDTLILLYAKATPPVYTALDGTGDNKSKATSFAPPPSSPPSSTISSSTPSPPTPCFAPPPSQTSAPPGSATRPAFPSPMAHSSNLPYDGDDICMICKKKSTEDETITCWI